MRWSQKRDEKKKRISQEEKGKGREKRERKRKRERREHLRNTPDQSLTDFNHGIINGKGDEGELREKGKTRKKTLDFLSGGPR